MNVFYLRHKNRLKNLAFFLLVLVCHLFLYDCAKYQTTDLSLTGGCIDLRPYIAEIKHFEVKQRNNVMAQGKIQPDQSIILELIGTESDYKNIAPEIEFQGASISPIAEQEQDFTKAVTYTVTSEMGYEVVYIVKTTFVNSSN